MSEVSRKEFSTDNPLGLAPGEQVFAVFSVELKKSAISFGLKITQEMRDAVRGCSPEARASIFEGIEALTARLKAELEVSQ